MLLAELLCEMIWEERFAAGRAARQFPDDWIHFSNVQKLGVNPQQTHRDPPGVYFYPTRWLLGDDPSLSQFATEHPYYFVVRIKTTANTVNLGRMTGKQVEAIANRNGWADDLTRIRQDMKLLDKLPRNMEPKLLRKPGGLFYAAMDYLVNVEGKTWLKMLRGIDAIIDPGFGIIAAGEPTQAIVIDRSLMTILAQGDNTDNEYRNYGKLMQRLADELQCKFYYKYKQPTIEGQIEGKPFTARLDFSNSRLSISHYRDGFWMVAEERVQGIGSNTGDDANDLRSLRYMITSTMAKAGSEGNDFYWNGETIREAFNLISALSRYKQNVREGTFSFSHIDSFGGRTTALIGRVDQQDQLRVIAEISLSSDLRVRVEHSFPPRTPVQDVANTVLDKLADKLRQAASPSAKLWMFEKITKFRFGGRFPRPADSEPGE